MKKTLRESFNELIASHPEIQKVILFGSYATKRYGPFSDADILLILDSSDRRLLDRIPRYIPDGLSFPVDVFPYTAAEIEVLRREGNHFIERAMCEGEVLFERKRENVDGNTNDLDDVESR
ncbi:MAG: nucleotidyltransferase domain-containing protein [bacterium]